MNRIARRIAVLLAVTLVTSGCFSQAGGAASPKKPEKKVGVTAEEMLADGPGPLAGGTFDEKKWTEALGKLPKNMTADEAYRQLILLMAEDYRVITRELDKFNPELELLGSVRYERGGKGGQGADTGKSRRQDIIILIDASGSMRGKVNGKVKMEEAIRAVREFAGKLPENVNVALRVYGHKGSNQARDKAVSCAANEAFYPLGPYREAEFNEALDRVKPAGWTPLAAAIRMAGEDLKRGDPSSEKVVYVVSDGVETCGGDPVKEAQALRNSDIQAIVNIIGFDLDAASQAALKKVAEAGGGEFRSVRSAEEMTRGMFSEIGLHTAEMWENLGRNQLNFWTVFEAERKFHAFVEEWLGGNITEGNSESLIKKENGRLVWSADWLAQNGKLAGGQEEKLKEKIEHRRQLLYQYFEQRKEKEKEKIRIAVEKAKEAASKQEEVKTVP